VSNATPAKWVAGAERDSITTGFPALHAVARNHGQAARSSRRNPLLLVIALVRSVADHVLDGVMAVIY
jgi:hypothetical protein